MRKRTALMPLLVVFLLSHAAVAQNKKNEAGLLVGQGLSSLLNSNASSYFTDRYNGVFEVSPFYRINFETAPFSLKFEYTQRTILSEFKFNESFDARISQAFMGFNVKGSYTKRSTAARAFEFFGGFGLYTLAQKRTPNPLSGLRPVDDGFAPYWGISFEADFSYSIPIDKYRIGMAWRVFALPSITFLNQKGIPEFYHLGSSIAIFTSF